MTITASKTKENWLAYCESELEIIQPMLLKLGFELDENQPHIKGERFLMQAVTTAHGKKLILLGKRISDQKKVVIKISSDSGGIEEIEYERTCRKVLHNMNFAYNVFSSPQELLFKKQAGRTISIQEFIAQDSTFLERPIAEQFTFALNTFKAQEGAHATTHKHHRVITKTFPIRNVHTYLDKFFAFKTQVAKLLPDKTELVETLNTAYDILKKESVTIEQYGSFLTHTDFVPHNFRIKDDKVYLLDHSSLTFGNKYEGWARFLNFMTLYNPALEKALTQYVKDNRTTEELQSLYLMRIYRLGEIIFYYTNTLPKSTGNLLELNQTRINFWANILMCIINDTQPTNSLISEYQKKRDQLRSEDEKERQKGLH